MLAAQISRYRDCFPGAQLAMVLASMCAGNTAGRLWEIPQPAPVPVLLLWDKGNNVFYLAGECQDEASLRALTDTVTRRVLPEALAEGVERFKVRALSASLEQELPRIFPELPFHASPSLFFVHDPGGESTATPTPGMDGFYLRPIRREMLVTGAYAGSKEVREEIRSMWPSEERFYEQGFGVVAIRDDEIICWCTAEYVGPTHCGTGIATRPDQQRKGIATVTAMRFIQEARRRGLTPCWECAVTNLPSIRVAEKTGFVRQSEETYWIGYLRNGAALNRR